MKMIRIFYFSVLLNLLLSLLGYSDEAVKLSHGVDVFKRLSVKYAKHFSWKGPDGNLVKISDSDELGSYLITVFSKKTNAGWINWANRHPIEDSGQHLGQCIFYEMLDIVPPRTGIEILLSQRLEDNSCDSETFWAALIFEICNALQAADFLQVMKDFKKGKIDSVSFSEKMMRIEYVSALNARLFQKEIWVPFLRKNKLPERPTRWFFEDNVNFDQWLQILSRSKKGRLYLETYKIQ